MTTIEKLRKAIQFADLERDGEEDVRP